MAGVASKKTALSLTGHTLCMAHPAQLIIQMNTQVSVAKDHFHHGAPDGDGGIPLFPRQKSTIT